MPPLLFFSIHIYYIRFFEKKQENIRPFGFFAKRIKTGRFLSIRLIVLRNFFKRTESEAQPSAPLPPRLSVAFYSRISVVIKSTPISISLAASSGASIVQQFTFIPDSCRRATYSFVRHGPQKSPSRRYNFINSSVFSVASPVSS